ncbi:FAD binding domain-containing protein [Nocardioides sp. LHG3406-4]|uniref:FAD binding domain-containing protein n=1 Tax=Nocardioides sp. LHG3406-4 TaxID=2804575 RepID=UPI003CF93224
MATFHVPETLDEALSLLAELEDTMVYGGGTAIQILLKQGILFTEHFIDISRVPGLREISADSDGVAVGPLVTLRQMETDARVRSVAPLASSTYAEVANPRVRNTASVAGNIAHGDYRLDPPTALVVLDATVQLSSVRGQREVSAREFFVDFQVTEVQHDEMITGIRIPKQPSTAGAFVKYSSLAENDWPCASAAVLAVPGDASGEPTEVRIGLGALAPTTRYLAIDIDPGTTDQDAVDAAIDIANTAIDPIEDIRGSATYKAHLGRVAVEEAVRAVMKELQDA